MTHSLEKCCKEARAEATKNIAALLLAITMMFGIAYAFAEPAHASSNHTTSSPLQEKE